jgi:hypothetical protein
MYAAEEFGVGVGFVGVEFAAAWTGELERSCRFRERGREGEREGEKYRRSSPRAE